MTKNIHFHPDGNFSKIFIQPLIDAEEANGHKVTLINSSNGLQGEIEIPYNLELKNLARLPYAFIKILAILFKQKPDYIVSHNTRSSLIPLLAAKLVKIPYIVYFNHGIPYLGHGGVVRLILLLIERINCWLASEIITVSRDMKQVLVTVTNKPVSIISNGSASGIDLNEHSKKKYEHSSFRSNYGIKKTDFVVVFIGRPEARKGYNFTLELWTRYFKEENSCKLIICGSDEIAAKKIITNIPENIIFMGFCNNIPEIISASDCLILPTLHEGLPYAILEALACECIVLSNDVEGVGELITNEKNGYLLRGNDYAEYFSQIMFIRNNSALLQQIKKAGLKTALKYSRPTYIKKYIEFINKKILN